MNLSGLRWIPLSQFVAQLIQFLALAVAARLITESEFGAYTLIGVVVAIVQSLPEHGLARAVVVARESEIEIAMPALVLSLISGIALGAVSLIAGQLLVSVFNHPHVGSILRLVSLSFPLAVIGAVLIAFAERRFAFGRVAIVRGAAGVVYASVLVIAAVSDAGAHSFAWAQIAMTVTMVVGGLVISRAVIHRSAPRRAYKRLVQDASNVSTGNVLNTVINYSDVVILGWLSNVIQIGYYNLAQRVARIPSSQISGLVPTIVLPYLADSTRTVDKERFNRYYLGAMRLVAYAVLPVMAVLVITAPDLVVVGFGEDWKPAIPVLQFLAVGIGFRTLGAPLTPMLIAFGRSDLTWKWNILRGMVLIPSFVVGANWDAEGLAVALMIATVALGLGFIYLAAYLTGTGIRSVASALVGPALYVSIAASISLSVQWMMRSLTDQAWLALVITGVSLGLVYGGLILWRERWVIVMLRKVLRGTEGSNLVSKPLPGAQNQSGA